MVAACQPSALHAQVLYGSLTGSVIDSSGSAVPNTKVEALNTGTGVLHGSLIVRGSGDPKLVIERLQDLMAQLSALGLRDIRGDIVLDRSVFEITPRTEAFDDEPLRPYNVSPDGLMLNFKALIYTFTPDASTGQVAVRVEPPLADFDAPLAGVREVAFFPPMTGG